MTRLLILFYTTYGTNHRMAECAEAAAREAGAEVRLRRVRETAPQEVIDGQDAWKAQLERMKDIPEAVPEDMEWASAYLVSAPTRFSSMPSQMQTFFDTLGPLWQKGAMANKPASGMTSTQSAHGGQETTLMHLHATFIHWGCIVTAPGYTDDVMFELGNPYGATAIAGEVSDTVKGAIEHQTRRMIEIAEKLAA
ncbi:NAD(P)H:quinone oxidoreductase [Roseovarius aquimarinus]|uniref:NAD(P)H:quinone oxidoreductase n=1 Tax=Roseovarius aquimarinus TaxID=1229156 RepID=A0ABW7I7U6_9RHOB